MSHEETLVGASAYPYAEEVLVEVTTRDADEDLVVYSYSFRVGDGDAVTPVEAVPERHCEVVDGALTEKGYEASTDLVGSPS